MAVPSIRLTVDGDVGTSGQSRTDAVVTDVVTATDTANPSASTYAWSLVVPSASSATLSNADTNSPTYTIDVVGNYLLFCVSDGEKSYSVNSVGEWISTQGGCAALYNGEIIPTPGETLQFSSTAGWSASFDNLLDDYAAGNLGGSGSITGPGSSTDNALTRWNGVGGDTLQDGQTIEDDSGNVTAAGKVEATGFEFERQSANPGDTAEDTIYIDDGTNYEAGTVVVTNKAVITGEVSIGNPGLEQGTVQVAGGSYDSILKVNDFGGGTDTSISVHRHSTTDSATIDLSRTKSDDQTHAAVEDNDVIGKLVFLGHDGTDYNRSSQISGEVDGATGSNDLPGRLVFATSPDGSNTPTEALRLDSSQDATFAGDIIVAGTVDGRDLATDGTKLDGIDAGAKTGDVVGPASATDNAFARFNLTTGKLVQNGQTTEDDSGNVSVAGTLSVTSTAGFSSGVGGAVQALTPSASVTPDCTDGTGFTWSIDQDATLNKPTNPPGNYTIAVIEITQDSTPRTLTLGTGITELNNGTAIALPTGSGDLAVLTLVTFNGGTGWYAMLASET